jgi:hypothetical protein
VTAALAGPRARSGAPLEVGPPVRLGPGHVELVVDGHPVTFTSEDVDLVPTPEASAAAFLLVAALLDRPLVLAEPVDRAFARNVAMLGRTVESWWDCTPEPLPTRRPDRGALRRSPRRAQFFSCGVDSFHTLLTARRPVDDVVFVHGFDVATADRERSEALERRIRAVAGSLGVTPLVVRSDIRDHPTFRSLNWEKTHGGAMAAVAHMLSHRCGTVLVPASPSYVADRPWGSHWRIDRRWSSPALRVVPIGMHRLRGDKVGDVAGHPLVDEHLQVCWEREGEPGNCCSCRKCILTMVMLEHHGALTGSRTLAPPRPLPEMLDDLPWTLLFHQSLEPMAVGSGELALAVRRYVGRAGEPAPARRWPRIVADVLRRP